MEVIEQRHFVRNLIVVAVISEFFSSFTLWLIQSEIKYPLFILETLSIIIIFLSLSDHDFKFTTKIKTVKNIPSNLVLDILLINTSVVLLVLNQFHIQETFAQPILSLLSTSFLSGYALLNICKIQRYFSKLESYILSYLVSFTFSGFCTLAFLWTDEFSRSLIIPSCFIVLGIFSAIRHTRNKDVVESFKTNSLSKNIDVIAIVFCIIFYVVLFYYFYPSFILVSGTDISRHYRNSLILSRSPDLYTGFNYLLFHSYYASLNVLSGFPAATYFESIQIILNLFLPLSIYAFAKRFLGELDKRIPAIAVVFYTILSGFSFLYFTHLKLLGDNGTEYQMLVNVMEKSFNATINFSQPFPFFGPQSVALIMFIMAFTLLRIQNIPKLKFVFLTSVLMLAMYLAHEAEAVLIAVFISAFSFLSRTKSLRLDDFLLSSLIALISAVIVSLYVSFFWHSSVQILGINFRALLPLGLTILFICVSMFWRKTILHKIRIPMKLFSDKRFYGVLCMILVFFYLLGLLRWFFGDDTQSTSFVETGVIPWFTYPLMLGILGLLALLTIRYLGDILPNSAVVLLLISIPFFFLVGRTISFVDLHFILTGFWV